MISNVGLVSQQQADYDGNTQVDSVEIVTSLANPSYRIQSYDDTIPALEILNQLGASTFAVLGNGSAYASSVHTNTIDPQTAGAGVTIDGLLIQNGGIQGLSHSSLTDLSADDHPQYILKDGRSGGQTVSGGVSAWENLNLKCNTASPTTYAGDIKLFASSVLPYGANVALGSTTYPFSTVSASAGYMPVICGATTASANLIVDSTSNSTKGSVLLRSILIPETNNTLSVGSQTNRFNNGYFTSLSCPTIIGSLLSGEELVLRANAAATNGNIRLVGSSVIPYNGTVSLGTTFNPWNSLTATTCYIPTVTGGQTSGGNLTLDSTIHATKGAIIVKSSMRPDTNGALSIGTASHKFGTAYIGSIECPTIIGNTADSLPMNIYSNWNAPYGSINFFTASLLPNANEAVDLGSSSKAWKDIYAKSLTISGNIVATSVSDGTNSLSSLAAAIVNLQSPQDAIDPTTFTFTDELFALSNWTHTLSNATATVPSGEHSLQLTQTGASGSASSTTNNGYFIDRDAFECEFRLMHDATSPIFVMHNTTSGSVFKFGILILNNDVKANVWRTNGGANEDLISPLTLLPNVWMRFKIVSDGTDISLYHHGTDWVLDYTDTLTSYHNVNLCPYMYLSESAANKYVKLDYISIKSARL